MTAVSDIDTEALTGTVRPAGFARTEVRHLAGPTSAAIAYKE